MREKLGPQAHHADQNKINRDQVIQQTWNDQDQDAEEQRDQRLDCQDIDMGDGHGRLRKSAMTGAAQTTREDPKRASFAGICPNAGVVEL
jgi:hypothetical protein